VPKIRDAISEMQAKMRVLEEFMFSLPHEAFTLCWSIVRLPQIVLGKWQPLLLCDITLSVLTYYRLL